MYFLSDTTQCLIARRYQIPSDAQVHLSGIAVHRDERIYNNPQSLQLNQWAGGLDEDLHEYAYIPFSRADDLRRWKPH
ncbi:cytochrome P450 [Saliphagus sp. LR7]|uniref:cytochrome P450 n=1 Tax=Saliphagus sp. LR7 TaxID=2282654 RepID=UPI000DF7ECFE